MAFPGGISLPIDMMRETAASLEQTGSQLRDDIDRDMRVANHFSWQLPNHLRENEQALETQFNHYLEQLLTARGSIARLLRAAADAAVRVDKVAGGALGGDQ